MIVPFKILWFSATTRNQLYKHLFWWETWYHCFSHVLVAFIFCFHAVSLPWKNVYIWSVVFTKIFSNIPKCNWWHWKMFYICAKLHWKYAIASYQYQYADNNALYNIVSVFWIFLPSHVLFATRHSILSSPTIKSFFLAYCILLQQKYR